MVEEVKSQKNEQKQYWCSPQQTPQTTCDVGYLQAKISGTGTERQSDRLSLPLFLLDWFMELRYDTELFFLWNTQTWFIRSDFSNLFELNCSINHLAYVCYLWFKHGSAIYWICCCSSLTLLTPALNLYTNKQGKVNRCSCNKQTNTHTERPISFSWPSK